MLGLEGGDIKLGSFAGRQPCLGDLEQLANAGGALSKDLRLTAQPDGIKKIVLRLMHDIERDGDGLGAGSTQGGIGGADAAGTLEDINQFGSQPSLDDGAATALG